MKTKSQIVLICRTIVLYFEPIEKIEEAEKLFMQFFTAGVFYSGFGDKFIVEFRTLKELKKGHRVTIIKQLEVEKGKEPIIIEKHGN